MIRKIGVATLLGLATVGMYATGAFAQCGTGFLIKWDADALAYENNYNPVTFDSQAGEFLVVVGKVSLFCSPLQDLDASDPTKEYTFQFAALQSNGTSHTVFPSGTESHVTDYGSGVFYIREDTSPDATFAPNPPNALVPSSFQDGTLILEGTLANFVTVITKSASGQFTTSFRADYDFTGPPAGTYYNRVQSSLPDILGGTWCVETTGLCSYPDGYSAHPNGKFDGERPTSSQAGTWGAIKSLYR